MAVPSEIIIQTESLKMKIKIIAAILAFICAPAFAAFDHNKQPLEYLHAVANFNGVYSDINDGTLVRISMEETLYVTLANLGLQGVTVESVGVEDKTITFMFDAGDGQGMATMQRLSDGIVWTLPDGKQMLMAYVRKLTMPDALVIACQAYPAQRRAAMLRKQGLSCK